MMSSPFGLLIRDKYSRDGVILDDSPKALIN